MLPLRCAAAALRLHEAPGALKAQHGAQLDAIARVLVGADDGSARAPAASAAAAAPPAHPHRAALDAAVTAGFLRRTAERYAPALVRARCSQLQMP